MKAEMTEQDLGKYVFKIFPFTKENMLASTYKCPSNRKMKDDGQ